MSVIKIEIDNEEYNVLIERKRSTKNTYVRVKEDLNIYVTCNTLTSDRFILNLINSKERQMIKMINQAKKKKAKEDSFYYLGKKYDLVYLNKKGITFGEEKVFVSPDLNLEKWYKKEAEKVFQIELDKMYNAFIYKIPYPSGLTIRKMKTRWGVCNVKTHKITLNLELIKKDIECLDYVIVHELSHLLYANHSRAFWECVGNNYKDYKKIRKELKDE